MRVSRVSTRAAPLLLSVRAPACAHPLGQIFYNAVQFFVFGQVKQAMLRDERLTIGQSFVAGAVTGVAVTYASCLPLHR